MLVVITSHSVAPVRVEARWISGRVLWGIGVRGVILLDVCFIAQSEVRRLVDLIYNISSWEKYYFTLV